MPRTLPPQCCFSSTVTAKPRSRSSCATERPPTPPPKMRTRGRALRRLMAPASYPSARAGDRSSSRSEGQADRLRQERQERRAGAEGAEEIVHERRARDAFVVERHPDREVFSLEVL